MGPRPLVRIDPPMNQHNPSLPGKTPTQVGHWKADDCDVYIGRGRRDDELTHLNNTSIEKRGWLGNPYRLEDGYDRDESVELYAQDLQQRIENDSAFREALADLRGATLGCWCQQVDEDGPLCHGEVLVEHIDALAHNREGGGEEEEQ